MISAENELLLCCARTNMAPVELDWLKSILQKPLDWEEVLRNAFWHGIAPLLYQNLKRAEEINGIPFEVLDKIKKAYYGNVSRNMGLYSQLDEILSVFHKERIKVIVLKGAVLAKEVYGDIGLRSMDDIDLFIKKADLDHIDETLVELGYSLWGHKSESLEFFNQEYHIKYKHHEKSIPLELHWHISRIDHFSRIRVIDVNLNIEWWEKAVKIPHSDQLMLSPEDLLFHLSLHFFKHRFVNTDKGFSSRGALRQLCDISETIKHFSNEINWGILKKTAKKYRMESPVSLTLYLLKETLGLGDDIQEDIFKVFDSKCIDKKFFLVIYKRMFSRSETLPDIPWSSLHHPSNSLHKIKNNIGAVFPPREDLARMYGLAPTCYKLYFYYIIRVFTLLLKYIPLVKNSKRKPVVNRILEERALDEWINSQDRI